MALTQSGFVTCSAERDTKSFLYRPGGQAVSTQQTLHCPVTQSPSSSSSSS